MMVHPADRDLPTMRGHRHPAARWSSTTGRASHAAAAPQQGRNALDAAVLGYVNVAALRQHIRADERIHGIFTKAGDKPNIVPRTAAAAVVRALDRPGLAWRRSRPGCWPASRAARPPRAAPSSHDWQDPAYADLVDDPWLLARWAEQQHGAGAAARGPGAVGDVVGSTDMGNVSHEVPSIHPMIAVAPPGVSIHTPEFAGHARGPAGDRAVLDGAKALAATVIDCWAAPRPAS